MWKKTVYLFIVIIAAYAYIMVNYPSDNLKPVGYNSLLGVYGDYFASGINPKIIYNPGLRKMNADLKDAKVTGIIPHSNIDYQTELETFLESSGEVLVECSGLDTWHSSNEGKIYLSKLRKQAYRVVVFDGGHHLPTLGLAPDIIIVPEFRGYAAHGYMQDGMQVNTIKEILQASQSRIVLVTVPRWSLVKTEGSLTVITCETLKKLSFCNNTPEPFTPNCKPRLSKYHGQMFAYINEEYAQDSNKLIKNCRSLGLEDIKTIYVACDYNYISPLQAREYVSRLKTVLGVEVVLVNEPVKVSDLFFALK